MSQNTAASYLDFVHKPCQKPSSLTRPACCQPASVTLLPNNWRGHLRWPMTSLVVHFCSAPLVCFVDALDILLTNGHVIAIRAYMTMQTGSCDRKEMIMMNCTACGERFSTYEKVVEDTEDLVITGPGGSGRGPGAGGAGAGRDGGRDGRRKGPKPQPR